MKEQRRVILGRWNAEREEEGQLKGGTISYWKRLIAEAGNDWTNVENLTKDRKKWKTLVKERQRKLIERENEMCKYHKGGVKPTRSQRVTGNSLRCRWEGSTKECTSKTRAT